MSVPILAAARAVAFSPSGWAICCMAGRTNQEGHSCKRRERERKESGVGEAREIVQGSTRLASAVARAAPVGERRMGMETSSPRMVVRRSTSLTSRRMRGRSRRRLKAALVQAEETRSGEWVGISVEGQS